MSDDIAARLRDIEGGYGFRAICREAADEIERLRAERDEARRRVCTMSLQLGQVYRRVGGQSVRVTTPEAVADMMGWRCFKEANDER